MGFKKTAVLIAAACIMLSGCTEVDYSSLHENAGQSQVASGLEYNENNNNNASMYTESLKKIYDIKETKFSKIFETEKDYSGDVFKTLGGYTGDGYITIDTTESFTLLFDAPSTQFYSITISAASEGANITLISGGSNLIKSENGKYDRLDGVLHGSYNIPKTDEFYEFRLGNLYLEKGINRLTFQSVNGIAHIDSVTIKNDQPLKSVRYADVITSLSGSEPDYSRISLMDYFRSIYGKYTLTAQYVTPGTNVELDVIKLNTGRLPAIRFSDLGFFTDNASRFFQRGENDVDLAVDYAKQGGIIGYSWYWYSPTLKPVLLASECILETENIANDVKDLAIMSGEELDILFENGRISEECMKILADMDSIANQLKKLKENDIPVLFRPLPQSGSGWYWWEKDADTYKWLWQTMHRRFEELHGLSNIIWVYQHANEDIFVGDDYIDIIGCDFYNHSASSGVTAMKETDGITLNRRMLAMTECEYMPSPDIMARDNAIWLWTGALSGGYLVNNRGELHGNYISVDDMKRNYNHELTITLDELKINE